MMALGNTLPRREDDADWSLDLRLEAMSALRWPNKCATEDIAVAGRRPGSNELSTAEQQHWLQPAAEDGDCYAMETLALRLIERNGSHNLADGLAWLRKAASLGSAIAMTRLAEYLLEEGQSEESSAEAERWLQESIEHGRAQSMITLGTRLITGARLPADPERGRELLRRAADNGSQLAHIKLGTYILCGRGLPQNRAEGYRWLRGIGVTEPAQLSLLGCYLYEKSLAAPIRGEARLLAEEAGVLFYESTQQGNGADAVNLAYLLRRNEISAAPYPSLDVLLSPHLQQNRPFALVNQALRLAKGVQCDIDWTLADILISKIKLAHSVFKWWSTIGGRGDAEGYLVIGWLSRRGLALDPTQLTIKQRMEFARANGWAAPEWMNYPYELQESRRGSESHEVL